ncbi:MAG TPA: DUF2079 domain-containing protein [Thermoanaerobaculia bacterium]|nr:DUF2079 domain-containing protein [Thermoanaerobaculia bacterium]
MRTFFGGEILLPALSILILTLFFLFKLVAFDRLQYFGDIFGFVQVAQGFADGYPLLHDNDFGDHKPSHNFYLVLSFFPLVRFLGAYGLFVVQLIFYLAALVAFYTLVRRKGNNLLPWCAWLIFFLGPVSFWLWDDAPYGWHAQILFPPLCLALAAGFLGDRRIALLAGILLILLHEQGAILCWAIHFTWIVVRAGAEQSRSPWKRLALVTAGWLSVFICGLLLQSLFHDGDQSRLSTSIARLELITRPPVRAEFIASIVDCLLLLLSGLVLLLAIGNRRAMAAAFLSILVLFVPATIAAMPYSLWWPELRNHAFAWPPRFVAMWSYLAACTLIAIWYGALQSRLRSSRTLALVLVVVSLSLQFGILEWRRGYSMFERVGNVMKGVPTRVTQQERDFLECLAGSIPPRSEVMTPPWLFSIFHHHYMWRGEHIPPVKPIADLIVVDLLNRSSYDGTELGRLLRTLEESGHEQRRTGSIVVGFSEEAGRAASGCFGNATPDASSY